MSTFKIGDIVDTDKGSGTVAFYGETQFSDGFWVGVILDEPKGRNNGTVKGVKYFSCAENCGIFCLKDKVRLKSSGTRNKSSFIKPLQSIRKPSNSRIPIGTDSNITTPSGTPRMTPASSMEMINRQKSFGNRLSNTTVTNTPKLQKVATPELASITEKNVNSPPTLKLENRTPSLVKEKAQKIDEKIVNSPVDTVFKLPESNSVDLYEVDYLKKEVKDLNEKLESLRSKRKEDYEKLKEYERNKINLQHLREFKLEITQAHSSLQQENEDLKQRLSEIESEYEKNKDTSRLLHQIESIGLDKEMAEEKAELLQSEINELQIKIQEQESELSLLKSEMDKGVVTGLTNDSSTIDGCSIKIKQLQSENERLKDAILRVRDAFSQTNKEVESLRKEVDVLNSERNELLSLCEKQQRELENAKHAITDLREQVDATMGSEKMIATLTDKNLDLEEKIRTLEDDVNELETLRTMDEEIIETQKDYERDLKQDIERHLAIIADLRRQLIDFDKRSKDYENVILMFRQKNSELKEEIQCLKDEILIIKTQEDDAKNSGAGYDNLSLKLVTINRTFADIVISEIQSIGLEFSQQHIIYLKSFLPDNFTKAGGDNDCVLLCIFFPRMAAKALSFIKLLNLKYPSVPNGIRREHITVSHKAEQWAHVKKFTYALTTLKSILNKFESVLKTCSVERLSRLAIQQLEITGQEKNLDMYFELLRQNRLDENTSVDNLYRIKIFATNMTSDSGNARETLENVVTQLKEGLLWIHFNCTRLSYFLELSENESSEFAKFVTDLVLIITECEGLSIRSLNRIPAENDLLLTSELNEKIMNTISKLERCSNVIHNTCSFAVSQLASIDVDGFSSLQMKEMLHSSVEKFVGSTDSVRAFSLLIEWATELKTFLVEISDGLENSSMEIPPVQKTKFPPLLERAHSRKNDVVEAEGLRWQISKKDEEILRLQKHIKARECDISTYKIRLEMADKQISNSAKSDDVEAQHLRTRCEQLHEDFVRQKNDYERKVEDLKISLKQALEERDKEREHGRELSISSLNTNVHNNILKCNKISPSLTISGANSQMDNASYDIVRLQTDLYTTLNDLKWAEYRIRVLEIQAAKQTLSEMRQIDTPDFVCGVHSMYLRNKKSDEKFILEKMAADAKELIEESNKFMLEPLNSRERLLYRNHVISVNNRIDLLKFRFFRFWNKAYPGKEVPKLFNGLISVSSNTNKTELKKNGKDERLKLILNKWKTDLKSKENLYVLCESTA